MRWILAFGILALAYALALVYRMSKTGGQVLSYLFSRGDASDPEVLANEVSKPAAQAAFRLVFGWRTSRTMPVRLTFLGAYSLAFALLSWPVWFPVFERALQNAARRYCDRRWRHE